MFAAGLPLAGVSSKRRQQARMAGPREDLVPPLSPGRVKRDHSQGCSPRCAGMQKKKRGAENRIWVLGRGSVGKAETANRS